MQADPQPDRREAAAEKPKKLSLKERLLQKKVGKKELQAEEEAAVQAEPSTPPASISGAVPSVGGSGMKTLEDALAEKEGRRDPALLIPC